MLGDGWPSTSTLADHHPRPTIPAIVDAAVVAHIGGKDEEQQ
jgi:hypothetical protein